MDGLNKSMYQIGSDSAFAILARSNELSKNGKDVINLGIGQPDFPTPENVVNAAIKAIKDGHHGYTASNGIYELRETVSWDFYKRNKIEIDPNDSNLYFKRSIAKSKVGGIKGANEDKNKSDEINRSYM